MNKQEYTKKDIELKYLSSMLENQLNNLQAELNTIKKQFDNSDKFLSVKHLDKYQCTILKSYILSIEKTSDKLWNINYKILQSKTRIKGGIQK